MCWQRLRLGLAKWIQMNTWQITGDPFADEICVPVADEENCGHFSLIAVAVLCPMPVPELCASAPRDRRPVRPHSPGRRAGRTALPSRVGGQVLLRGEVTGEDVRILVALAVPEAFGVAVGVHQVGRHGSGAVLFDLFAHLEERACRVGFGRGGQVEGGFNNGVNAFGHADVFKGIGGRSRPPDALRVGQANIFARPARSAGAG